MTVLSLVTMQVQIIIINLVLYAALVESLTNVLAYPGANVTLPSGADPTWMLSKIEWLVYPNTTSIATYIKKRMYTDWFHLYKGRLDLNATSGDLTIRNLSKSDAIEYSVNLIDTHGRDTTNRYRLVLRERLRKPTIHIGSPIAATNGNCWVLLRCSSADDGVDLSWQASSPDVTFDATSEHDGKAVVTSAFVSQSGVNVTCISSKNVDDASSVVALNCEDKKPQPELLTPEPHPSRKQRFSLPFFLGGFLGASLTTLILYYLRRKRSSYPVSERQQDTVDHNAAHPMLQTGIETTTLNEPLKHPTTESNCTSVASLG